MKRSKKKIAKRSGRACEFEAVGVLWLTSNAPELECDVCRLSAVAIFFFLARLGVARLYSCTQSGKRKGRHQVFHRVTRLKRTRGWCERSWSFAPPTSKSSIGSKRRKTMGGAQLSTPHLPQRNGSGAGNARPTQCSGGSNTVAASGPEKGKGKGKGEKGWKKKSD